MKTLVMGYWPSVHDWCRETGKKLGDVCVVRDRWTMLGFPSGTELVLLSGWESAKGAHDIVCEAQNVLGYSIKFWQPQTEVEYGP